MKLQIRNLLGFVWLGMIVITIGCSSKSAPITHRPPSAHKGLEDLFLPLDGVTLQGKVFCNDKVVPFGMVMLMRTPDAGTGGRPQLAGQALLQPDGSYKLSRLPSGHYVAHVTFDKDAIVQLTRDKFSRLEQKDSEIAAKLARTPGRPGQGGRPSQGSPSGIGNHPVLGAPPGMPAPPKQGGPPIIYRKGADGLPVPVGRGSGSGNPNDKDKEGMGKEDTRKEVSAIQGHLAPSPEEQQKVLHKIDEDFAALSSGDKELLEELKTKFAKQDDPLVEPITITIGTTDMTFDIKLAR